MIIFSLQGLKSNLWNFAFSACHLTWFSKFFQTRSKFAPHRCENLIASKLGQGAILGGLHFCLFVYEETVCGTMLMHMRRLSACYSVELRYCTNQFAPHSNIDLDIYIRMRNISILAPLSAHFVYILEIFRVNCNFNKYIYII